MSQTRVLIVDDESSLRRALRITLTALGFEVVEASTGEQALAAHVTARFDAALLDVNMPGMGGIETCREMRRRDDRIRIVMLTVLAGDADRTKAFEAGADSYFTKPYSISEVVACLNAKAPNGSGRSRKFTS